MNKNETALEMCLRMLRERANYWFNADVDDFEAGASVGYSNAADFLEYAMQNNIEALRQLDYYHENKKEE